MTTTVLLQFNVVILPGVELSVAEERVSRLASSVLEAENQRGNWEVNLVLTTDAHLRQLHRDFMGLDSETDVMTFPAEAEPGVVTNGGDIIVSVDRARDQAGEYGHSTADEIVFLAVHGLLHLCGWIDDTPQRRTAMLTRQTDLIGTFNQREDATEFANTRCNTSAVTSAERRSTSS